MPFLEEQIDIIRPRVIVCLGRIAAMKLIAPDFKIMQQHGMWFKRDGYDITATLHPAALLRDPAKKPLAYEDFKVISRMLEQV
ncbi:Type-4 uracil-DNA glycosylase [bioreactor metagenome]|uniref:Type-4 uracil-DNA glycosylase n=1 Tax=bioreactor metagenome TaxID=1076179 RepID=A0A644ZSV8_9ZZZZ